MQITTGRIPKAIKTVIYGPEGIGKSTFAAQFPGALFIDTEGSTVHMDVRRLPKPDTWGELIEEVNWALAHTDQMQTLVIDTADWAEILCSEHICARDKKTGIEDFGYGKGYVYLMEEFGRLLNLLQLLADKGVHIVITAHAQMRKFEQPDELGSYDRWEMKCSKKVAPMIKEWADMVLFACYKTVVVNVDGQGATKGKNKAQGGVRVIRATHHPCWDAKNRFGLPEEMPFDYGQIRAIIDGSTPAERAEAAPATPAVTPAPTVDNSPAPEPEPPQAPPAPPQTPGRRWPELPPALERMMAEAQVEPDEVRGVIAARGIYPADTPWHVLLENEQFMNGWLMHPEVWPKVVDAAKQRRMEAPF